MTQNQIAARSNEIAEENAVEIRRHNAATEELTAQSMEITRQYNETMSNLKRNELELNERISQAKLALERAQGDERNRINNYLANIEELKASNAKQIADKQLEIDQHKAETQQRQQAEDARHNVELESNNKYTNDIRKLEVMYDNYQFLMSNNLKQQELEQLKKHQQYQDQTDRLRQLSDSRYQEAMTKVNAANAATNLYTAQTEAKQGWAKVGVDVFRGITQAVGQSIQNKLNLVSTGFKLLTMR